MPSPGVSARTIAPCSPCARTATTMASVSSLNCRRSASSARVEIVVDAPRRRAGNTRNLFQILERGALDRAGRSEVHQQRPLAPRADAGNLVERTRRHALRALLAMGADGKAVGLVAQALEIEEGRRVGRKGHLATARQ